MLAAAGHGRAYSRPGRVLGRVLPPIADCGLWHEIEREPGLRTRALIADIGNDLALGAAVEETLEAVGSCLARLAAAGSETVVVSPPLAGVERLSRTRFLILRSLLFPGRTFDHPAGGGGHALLLCEERRALPDGGDAAHRGGQEGWSSRAPLGRREVDSAGGCPVSG